jgi:hypothetical protein
LNSRSRKDYPVFSPDGHWVAYRSDETGTGEIYVVPYPGPGGKILISTEGGLYPRWSRDGRELFYRGMSIGRPMMAVDVQARPAFRAGTPKVLFRRERICDRLRYLAGRQALPDDQDVCRNAGSYRPG